MALTSINAAATVFSEPLPSGDAIPHRTGALPADAYHGWYILAVWRVVYLPEAEREREALPAGERVALYHAVAKLEAIGPSLGFPHSSAVQAAKQLRELRPRAGRSPWRALYRLVGEVFVIAAVGPEAQRDPRGFARACRAAEQRLSAVEE